MKKKTERLAELDDRNHPPVNATDTRDEKTKRLNVLITPVDHLRFGDEARALGLNMTEYFYKLWNDGKVSL